MKTQKNGRNNTLKLLGAALGITALMTGCMNAGVDASSEVEVGGSGAVLTGTVAASTSGEVAVVTTHEVDAEGNVGPAVDSAHAEADGSFRIHTNLRGEKALIILAARKSEEWMARFEDRLENGSEKAVGVLDVKSSVDAEAWVELRRKGDDSVVAGSDIRAAVEAYADSLGLEGYQGNLEERKLLVARIVLMAKARAHARAAVIAALIVRADAIRDSANGTDSTPPPRPDMTPCERAAFLIAAMDPEHPDYAVLRARFAANCMGQDTIPPTPEACVEMRERIDGLDPATPVALGLRLRIAAYCTADMPPPQPLTRCERAAVRLTLMDPDRPSADTLRAHFEKRCLDADATDDPGMDSVMVEAEAGASAGAGPAAIAADLRAAIHAKK